VVDTRGRSGAGKDEAPDRYSRSAASAEGGSRPGVVATRWGRGAGTDRAPARYSRSAAPDRKERGIGTAGLRVRDRKSVDPGKPESEPGGKVLRKCFETASKLLRNTTHKVEKN